MHYVIQQNSDKKQENDSKSYITSSKRFLLFVEGISSSFLLGVCRSLNGTIVVVLVVLVHTAGGSVQRTQVLSAEVLRKENSEGSK